MSDQQHRNTEQDLKALRAQFDQLPAAEPSAELDRKVLAMAAQALDKDKPRGIARLFTEHVSLLTTAAAAVFAVGVVLILSDPTKEVSPARMPADPPLEVELIEREATVEERLPTLAKPQAASRPAPPSATDQAAPLEIDPTTGSATDLAAEALSDAAIAPEPAATVPAQQLELSVPAAENEALDQGLFLPLPETAASSPSNAQAGQYSPPVGRPDPDAERKRRQAPTPEDGLNRYIQDPGSSAPSQNDPPLESIIVTGSSIQSPASPEAWDKLIAEARAAKDAGEEARLTRILEYLETHYPDRALPDDLLPDSGNSGDP